ncbi:hypothetical protein CC1G_13639 [Coprinopsis cinerea okayama7|uniref:Uncharacterized protein n=1 Tax=Coprinopsis cinerea (strain Okayama-7 / 130 / ATCC MYA-4618 / FGSC 9003) TaxID=240176 RepID=D6RK58_COPC7|nr:hypothetical protein CC1G_13639 [Coprinopsis cinerea okayama7\|eukprot:XP_002912107.1 hypothetical protein CC1G_13639 [Coprinopsis cinerea okayama7\
MLEVYSQPISRNDYRQTAYKMTVLLNEKPANFHDAVESFTKLVQRSRKTSTRLLCTVPTWDPSAEDCWDLQDFQELRSRFLVFVHEVITSLRNAGLVASYSLAPSGSSRGMIVALPSNTAVNQQVVSDSFSKIGLGPSNGITVMDTKAGPSIVIS